MSGFKGCGIYSFQPDVFLKKLLDFQSDADKSQKASVSDVFIDTLKSTTGVGDDGEPPKKRRVKENVTAGKGVTPTDKESSSDSESVSNDKSDSSSDDSTSSESEDTCSPATVMTLMPVTPHLLPVPVKLICQQMLVTL